MDEIDRRIIFYLLKKGRISQNELSKLIGISVPSISHRFKRLISEGIIRSFKLFVNPNLYGKYYVYAAFKNIKDIEHKFIFSKFKCLEEFNVYGIEGNSLEELEKLIENLSNELGPPFMKYLPSQNFIELRKEYLKLIYVLNENPRLELHEIAKRMDIKVKKLRKILNEIKNYMAVIPEVNLIKCDSFLLAIFSKRMHFIKTITSNNSILTIDQGGEGIEICFINGLNLAKSIIERIKSQDPSSYIMLVYDYSIRGI